MKFRLQGSVTIPKRPSTVGGLIGWARGVNNTLQELRDRKIVGSIAKGGLAPRLPFQVTAGSQLQAAPGVFCDTEFDVTIESTPEDGTWYFQGLLVIDDTDGSIVSATVEWNQTEGVDSDTDFYTTIAIVEIDNTTPNPPIIVQYNYGTIVGIIHGSIDQVWNVTFF
jgi:hypothetical protein